MTTNPTEQLIADVARDVVAQAAPQELPLFGATSQAYFRQRAHLRVRAREDMLGFGVGEVATLITPVILGVVGEVVRHVGNEAEASVKEESAGVVKRLIRWLFGRFERKEKRDSAPPALSAAQLAQVHEVALEKARQFKLSNDQAQLLADALVGRLATRSAGEAR